MPRAPQCNTNFEDLSLLDRAQYCPTCALFGVQCLGNDHPRAPDGKFNIHCLIFFLLFIHKKEMEEMFLWAIFPFYVPRLGSVKKSQKQLNRSGLSHVESTLKEE